MVDVREHATLLTDLRGIDLARCLAPDLVGDINGWIGIAMSWECRWVE